MRHPAQRRTLTTLVVAQMLGGVGVASGIAVMALLARRVSGSDEFAGLGTTTQVLGGALLAVPLARLMSRRGRRPGLVLGYAVAIVGALVVVLAASLSLFPVLLIGTALFGAATTANSQSRYAAADLALPEHRGRDLSLVVWATTIGSVLGPNLVGPAEPVARALGLPPLTGSFVFAVLGFLGAGIVLQLFLRPDPLLLANGEVDQRPAGDGADRSPRGTPSVWAGLRSIAAHPGALLGLVTMVVGHAVMVSVMVVTPLHMDHGGASLRLVGFVISMHILGMYAPSPLTGLAVDRFGGQIVALVGSVVLVAAGVLASTTAAGMSVGLTVALVLLGIGWSATLVAGSALLTNGVAVSDRAAAQGLGDLCMGLAGASGGAVAGLVLGSGSYRALGLAATVAALLIPVAALVTRRRDRQRTGR